MKSINTKITGFSVGKKEDASSGPALEQVKYVSLEKMDRPETLKGTTYKIKPGEYAYYITINDIEVDGTWRPFEIFVNTQDNGSMQWIAALTRIISAVLRKGGEYEFLAEELKMIADPNGGRWHKGKYIKSLVAEIGMILQQHIEYLEYFNEVSDAGSEAPKVEAVEEPESEIQGSKCGKCGAMAVVPKDGCPTCLACGESKCG